MVVLYDDLWDYSDAAGTEAKLRGLVDGSSSPDQLELLTQIARTFSLRRQFQEAHALLDEVEAVDCKSPVVRCRYLLERGRTFNSDRKVELARPLFLEAFETATNEGLDFYAVDAAHMVAITETNEEALAWNLKALEIAENSKDPRTRLWQGSLLNNIGWALHDSGRYAESLKTFQKQVDWRLENQKDKVSQLRIAKWSVARARRSLGGVSELKQALQEQQQLLKDYEEDQSSSPMDTGYVLEEIAELQLLLGQKDNQTPTFFKRAYDILKQDDWLQDNEPKRMNRLRDFAETEAVPLEEEGK